MLDEIDQLVQKDPTVLYQLFEWPSLADSKLILIGIANALDMTERLLPRLRSKGRKYCTIFKDAIVNT